jgi:hypothetical protein
MNNLSTNQPWIGSRANAQGAEGAWKIVSVYWSSQGKPK